VNFRETQRFSNKPRETALEMATRRFQYRIFNENDNVGAAFSGLFNARAGYVISRASRGTRFDQ